MRAPLPILAALLAASALGFAPAPYETREPKVFTQRFTLPAADVTKGYGKFAYEATPRGWKAEVSGGKLRLRGDHPEGDQRLCITAEKALGKPQWPDSLDITAKLGGTGEDNVAWHVGVSIGAVKVLFHPAFPEGAFRAERVDTHAEFFPNENMGFTPAAGVMHQLTIRVRRTERGRKFEVEVADGNRAGTYRKSFEVPLEQAGKLDRIGLERSGRRGGDALFESLSIAPVK